MLDMHIGLDVALAAVCLFLVLGLIIGHRQGRAEVRTEMEINALSGEQVIFGNTSYVLVPYVRYKRLLRYEFSSKRKEAHADNSKHQTQGES